MKFTVRIIFSLLLLSPAIYAAQFISTKESSGETCQKYSGNMNLRVYDEKLNILDKEERTPLITAVVNSKLTDVKNLLELGADPNFALEPEGLTALHMVALRTDLTSSASEKAVQLEIAKLLMAQGAEINALYKYWKTEKLCTPLDLLTGFNETISNLYQLRYQGIDNKIEKETLRSYLITQGAISAVNQ